jgi:hypothetical protein
MFANLPVALPHVKANKVRAREHGGRALAARAGNSDGRRIRLQGLRDCDVGGMFGPTGMPPDLVTRIQRDVSRIVNQPDNRERLTGLGVDIVAGTPDELGALRSEIARYTKVIRNRHQSRIARRAIQSCKQRWASSDWARSAGRSRNC